MQMRDVVRIVALLFIWTVFPFGTVHALNENNFAQGSAMGSAGWDLNYEDEEELVNPDISKTVEEKEEPAAEDFFSNTIDSLDEDLAEFEIPSKTDQRKN